METEIAVAMREAVGAYRFGEPAATIPETWRFGDPTRYPIGWFDYDASPPPAGDMGDGEDTSDTDQLGLQPNLMRTLAAVLQAPLCALTGVDNVLEWPAPLLPFQRQGVVTLLDRQALLLADEMGLGKTIQSIAAMRILFHRADISSALVVCPTSVIVQWRRELARWAPELTVLAIHGPASERGRLWRLPAHVKLVGYETLRGDVLDHHDSPATKKPWGVLVLDEASRIKNAASGVSMACKQLPAERRWALTGTPVENSQDDAASILEFLLKPVHGLAVQKTDPDASLSSRFRSHVLRRRVNDVLPQLPAKRIFEIAVELEPSQRAAYDRAEQEGILRLDRAGDSVTIVHILELISRLKQICNFDPVSGNSSKLNDIREKLQTLTAEGRRALIFSQFTEPKFGVARVAEELKDFHPLTYTGQMTAGKRSETLERFVRDKTHKALLLSLRAGGQGLNLQAASCVFHLDRWWNPAIEEQAESRSHRLGQQSAVTIYRYLCVNTIEERIDAKLRKKREIFQEFVDDERLDITRSLTETELFDLFGLTKRRSR
ncbi:MAG TPA: DEAD/DEAH box helicase [Capsulimonadaceae bacterium]|jgi:SNF2 family DNA or RNA helicase